MAPEIAEALVDPQALALEDVLRSAVGLPVTAEPPPGVAEKVIWAEPGPAVLGAKTTRTVHEAFATRTVVLDTQSPEFPLSTTKVVPLDFTLICPLVCWPVFVMVKVATLLD